MTPAKRMRSKSIHTSAPILHREESDDSVDENKIKIKDSSNSKKNNNVTTAKYN